MHNRDELSFVFLNKQQNNTPQNNSGAAEESLQATARAHLLYRVVPYSYRGC